MYPLESTSVRTNPLSLHWRYLAGHRTGQELEAWNHLHFLGDHPVQVLCTSFFMYTSGMIGFAFSLITRVLGVVKDSLVWIASFFASLGWVLTLGHAFADSVKGELNLGLRSWVLLGSFLELGSGIIGTACPPIGYALDERIHTNATWDHYSFNFFSDEYASDLSDQARNARFNGYRNEPFLGVLRVEKINASRFVDVSNNKYSQVLITSLAILSLIEDKAAGKDLSKMNYNVSDDLKTGWNAVKLAVNTVYNKESLLEQRQLIEGLLIRRLINRSFAINSLLLKEENKQWMENGITDFINALITSSKEFLGQNNDRKKTYFEEIFR